MLTRYETIFTLLFAFHNHLRTNAIFCRRLAETMRRHLLDLGFKDFGLTGNFNFALNQPTEYPNALLEVLFMSSLPDEEKLLDPKWQRKIADAVVDGILEYVKKD